MSDGLTRFRIGISIVFSITLLIFFFQLWYVLWRRRLHRRQHLTTGDESDINSTIDTTGSSTPYYSKELLYFFCWKNQAGIDQPVFPSSTTGDNTTTDHKGADSNDHELDVSKLQELYGLFTIKEDKEEFEYFSDHDNLGDDESISSIENTDNMERVSSEKSSDDDDECDSMVTIVIHDEEEDIESSTSYSTPCNSPPYYTPSPSPSRDDNHDEIDQA
ncbi:uncharacterized protein LOC113323917 [Papaver somniferum]|uniref:uncharacterized protein LOC113323917 n=1 Tax=Papaver somniferum TaxID=3469 RepID=UPI000E6F976B|nr:uncharacterized protein LOC113323917 [Papaver somniferum]